VRKGLTAITLLALSGLLAACGGGSGSVSAKKASPAAGATTTTPAAAKVMVANSSLGMILADAKGRTLYAFANDSPTMSNCTTSCAALWPPLTATGQPVGGSSVDATKLTVLTGANGMQVVYAGHPLYTFAQDSATGDVKGQGFAGGLWHVISPTGQIVTTAAASSSGSSTGGSTSGSGSNSGSQPMGGYGY
jgi:predicted lipoprotein with Yx(FWY)xxD motif